MKRVVWILTVRERSCGSIQVIVVLAASVVVAVFVAGVAVGDGGSGSVCYPRPYERSVCWERINKDRRCGQELL